MSRPYAKRKLIRNNNDKFKRELHFSLCTIEKYGKRMQKVERSKGAEGKNNFNWSYEKTMKSFLKGAFVQLSSANNCLQLQTDVTLEFINFIIHCLLSIAN